MKKLLLFFTAIVFFSQFALAQNGMVFGTVKDSIGGAGVAYAHIIILDEAGNNFNNMGGITDEKGNYRIDQLPYGSYSLKISCLGYETKTLSGVQLTAEQKRLKMDIPVNINIKALDEVVIIDSRPSIEFKPDKKIVHISIAAAAGGESVADFLQTLPEIKVDGDVVTLNTYDPVILVNGKPAGPAMSDLTQVPASLISSAEVITNPSVRYNPEGLGGIINLKTRKMPEGINGMIQGNGATNNKHTGAATLNYRTKKWNTFANVYDRYFGAKEEGSLDQQFDAGNSLYQTQSLTQKINRISARVGADFDPDSVNAFTLYWEYSKRNGTMNYGNEWEKNRAQINSRLYSSEQNMELDSRDHQIAFNYIHTFKNEGELDIDISQVFGYEPTDINMLFREDAAVLNYYNKEHYDGNESSIYVNYSSPIFKTWDLEAGTTLDREKSEAMDSMSGNLGYNHLFDMDRLINAYYLSLGTNFGKFGVRAGLRGEYASQKLNSAVYQSDDGGNFDFFPNLGLNYNINDAISLSLGYGRRIERPHIYALIPYTTIDYMFPSQRYVGNPDLNPSHTNAVNLGGYFNWTKLSASLSASYMNTGDDIADVYYSQDSLTYATRKNIATSQKILFNAEIDYHSRLWGIYRPILTARFGQELYDSPDETGENIHKSFFNYHLNLYNMFYLPKGFYIYVDATYYPRTHAYASVTEDMTDLSLRVRKTFKNNNFVLQVAFYNMLDSHPVTNVYGDGFTSRQIDYPNTRAVNFGIMYKFGKPIRTRTGVELNLNKIDDK